MSSAHRGELSPVLNFRLGQSLFRPMGEKFPVFQRLSPHFIGELTVLWVERPSTRPSAHLTHLCTQLCSSARLRVGVQLLLTAFIQDTDPEEESLAFPNRDEFGLPL